MDEKTRAVLIEYAQASEEAAAKLKRAMANLSLASNTGKPNIEAIFMNLSFEKRTSDRTRRRTTSFLAVCRRRYGMRPDVAGPGHEQWLGRTYQRLWAPGARPVPAYTWP